MTQRMGDCTAAKIRNCMLMLTEVNSKTHTDLHNAEAGYHSSNVSYFLPDVL